MKICFFTSTFLPQVGGLEYVVHYLTENLTEAGHQVTVLTGGRKQKMDNTVPYRVHRYRGAKGLLSSERVMAIHLIFEKLRIHFDVLHAHRTYPAGYVGAKLRNFLNVPLVITPQGDDIQKVPEINYGIRLQPELEAKVKYGLKRADAVTAIGNSVRNEILALGTGREKVYDIPNGVELNTFAGQKSSDDIVGKYNISSRNRVILAVGRNHIKKGYIYLVKSMSQILRKRKDVTLIIAGKGTESLLPLINELGITSNVILPGIIDNKRLPALYRRSDLFVLPSLIEGFCVVIVEAMACGLPIIGTNVPGIKDVVVNGVNGFLVPPKNPAALADKIIYSLENDEIRRRMAEKSREMAKQYDWKIITKKYIEVYKEVLGRYRH